VCWEDHSAEMREYDKWMEAERAVMHWDEEREQ
jgi:hypothetical protein